MKTKTGAQLHDVSSRGGRPARMTIGIVLLIAVALSVPALDVQQDILIPAQQLQGRSYCNRGVGPSCFDCSGFVTYLYRSHIPGLPRVSRDMARFGSRISRDELRPGDLVFFATSGRSDLITHVAVYMGQDSIIHAISDGPNRGVSITPMSARYWRTRYHSAVRVLPDLNQTESPARVASGTSGGGAGTTGGAGSGAAPAGGGPAGGAAGGPSGGGTAGSGAAATESTRVEDFEFATGTYTGPLQDGEPHGRGVMVMNNGDRYEGEFVDGFFEGAGEYRWTDGTRYVGQFQEGALHGEGTIVRPDGSRITGRWEQGERVAGGRDQSSATGGSAAGAPASGRAASGASEGTQTTALQRADSPWNDWDGVVAGDFYAWLDQDQRAFEEWKKNN